MAIADARSLPWTGPLPTLADVYRARAVVRNYLQPTPAIESASLSERMGCRVIVKCENLQPIGAFKVRGGVYLLSQMTDEQRAAGVVGASTGNHGQSIAYAARLFGVQATIFVPEGANPLKVEAMKRLGAEVIATGPDFDTAHDACKVYAAQHGKTFIHSADVPELIAGVGTYTLELLEEHPEIDAMFVPVGGGSGLCGALVAGKGINPDMTVYGVQSAGAPAVHDSWRDRELKKLDRCDTFAEGVATREAFALPAAVMWDRVDDILLVSDSDLKRSILTLLETTRMLAEGAGAAALAGLAQRREEMAGKTVGIVLSGGNLTLDTLQQIMTDESPW
ncbi:MAG TPA: threonine/serine dehydratase [Thermomicrobiales bacterium]|nr:threonine/serine dehydratase [Thermomicrobiales bacterium]